jgi:DNA-binding SARP family transcriptional activator
MLSQSATDRSVALPTTGLYVYLLGPPYVEWAGHVLPISRRQVRAILYYLATHLQPRPREHLIYLFWPDIPDSRARRNLSHLLTHLRCNLPTPEVLLIADDQVALDPQRSWSDTVAFQQLHHASLLAHRAESLRQAVDLYRGPFLASFSLPTSPEFEAWATLERCAWERRYLETLAALVEGHMTRGNHQAAIDCARRYLAVDDLNEDMHRRLIELYAAAGDRGAAVRQFEQCALTLERELGTSPLLGTRTAYQMTISGRLPPRQPGATVPPTWTTLPTLEVPLIGRTEALRHLQEAYDCARLGRGRLVLISGEPGIGKTRLLQHFVTSQADKASAVVSAGHEAERAMPYWPLVEALRPYLPHIGQAMPGMEPVYLSELARLWPELESWLPDLPAPPPLEPEQARTRMFRAMSCWLLSLAAWRPPLILCLDDLHWADEATLAWLGYLARQIRRAPLLVLGAYRCEAGAAVNTLRAELARLGLLEEVSLEALSRSEVLDLIRHVSGQSEQAEQLSQRLYQETGGNPFFLLETLRAIAEAKAGRQAGTGWDITGNESSLDCPELPLPNTVCEAIRARLGNLSPQAHQVLEAGAVLGRRFSFELACVTSGRRQHETVEALDELEARHMLVGAKRGYQFKHDLFRKVVYRDLSCGRRLLLHRRAGEALRKLRPGDAASLAWHFEQAEELGLAARYALQAGLAAKAVFAHAEARAFFDQALACLEGEAPQLQEPEARAANRRLRVQALAERGWAFRLLGDMDAYAQDSQEVARLAGLLGDYRTLAHLRWREACTRRWFCRYPEALESAEEGARLSQAAQDALLEAHCWREAGMAARALGDYARAQAALEHTLGLFSELGEAVYEIHALGNLSTLHWYRGEYEQATALARQALARCEAAGLPLERRLPLGDLGVAAGALGELDLAERCLLESLTIARQVADHTQEILCLGQLGWLCLRREQPGRAPGFLREALAIAEGINSQAEQSWLWSGLAEAHRLGGNAELALENARRALALAQDTGRAYDLKLAQQILAGLGDADL